MIKHNKYYYDKLHHLRNIGGREIKIRNNPENYLFTEVKKFSENQLLSQKLDQVRLNSKLQKEEFENRLNTDIDDLNYKISKNNILKFY